MKRIILSVVCLMMLASVSVASAQYAAPVQVAPRLSFIQEPNLVLVPSLAYPDQYAYMIPNVQNIFAVNGFWYRWYAGHWFESTVYNGVWTPVNSYNVPPILISFTVNPLYVPYSLPQISYQDYLHNWKLWQASHYFNNQDWYKKDIARQKRQADNYDKNAKNQKPTVILSRPIQNNNTAHTQAQKQLQEKHDEHK